jgi:DNA-binding transcriptional LysR family regulator
MLTLRQIEIIRAIMITGSVGGAARLLNVSSPGISRVMKHAEGLLGLKLFSRKGGRYTPTRRPATSSARSIVFTTRSRIWSLS